MRTFIIVVLAWSGAVYASPEVIVESEVCDIQIQAQILVSASYASSSASEPSHYEGTRCTTREGDQEVVLKDGVQTSDVRKQVTTSLRRQIQTAGSREIESLDIDVKTSADGAASKSFTSREANIYEVSQPGACPAKKTLVARTADGESRELSEVIEEMCSGDSRVIITTTRDANGSRVANDGKTANIRLMTRTCRLQRIHQACPATPVG